MKKTQTELSNQFLKLHQGPDILVLPNAWDVASARIFEEAEFAAIGTSSAGVAFSLGHPDGQQISREEMLGVVRRIAEAVDLPVTADVEAGFGSTPEEVADTARAVIDAGAVGMNLEDGAEDKPGFLQDLNKQKEMISAVVEAATSAGVPFVLNARTDIFLYGIGPAETRLSRTIERLNAFREAGAQSLFVPGVKDSQMIGQLVRGVAGPLNILATMGTPPVAELQQLGVARVSVGSGPMRATLGFLGRMARELREQGVFKMMTEGALTYVDANRMMHKK
ncbi:MAG TPA: isocitrate lyase/phosphoenolpyruvate mutase family protein [Candidatus Saccharimonadales bacterium]|jgi:2-methylisocitrate lyase-like PEP mutase family enzyme|nr:isocitrate lyase/phosphoenolpyruvate mutase family protein [Candidatus Saccharimonadales bacterium]